MGKLDSGILVRKPIVSPHGSQAGLHIRVSEKFFVQNIDCEVSLQKMIQWIDPNKTNINPSLVYKSVTFLKSLVNAEIVQLVFCVYIYTDSDDYKSKRALHEYTVGVFRKPAGYQIFYYLFCMTILHLAVSA